MSSVQLPPDIRVSVAVYDEVTTAGVQSYSGTASRTLEGGMLPLSVKARALLGGDPTYTHLLIVGAEDSIAEGAKVIIDSIRYSVVHVDTHTYGNHPHKEIVLAKSNA